ncbi:MAG TPA: amino acid adenylation domain-containing protein, partial [Actinokineospora sp.]|nr:amino acid adenylation domain-containing protein [Actinokineospora sp.]
MSGGATDLPLTGAQKGIWLASKFEPESPTYTIAAYLELNGPVDLDRLAAAVAQAVGAAEAVHVRVFEVDGEPRQRVVPAPVDVEIVDLRSAPDPESAALDWMLGERLSAGEAGDLAGGPLFGQALIRLAEQRVFWYQRYHHILIDGAGVLAISRYAGQLYNGTAGEAPDWSLARFVAADQRYRAGDDFERDREFWSRRLADRPEPARLVARAANQPSRRIRRTIWLTPERAANLRAAASETGQRLNRFLLAASGAYIHRLTGEQDLVLGLPVSARTDRDTRSIPGMASNVVPLRVRFRPDQTTRQAVAAVAAEILATVRHGRYLGDDLARDLGLRGGVADLVGPTVNILPFHPGLAVDGCEVTAHYLWQGHLDNLTITMYESREDSRVRIDFDADPAVCTEDDLADHERRFGRLLDGMAAAVDAPIGGVDLLARVELDQALGFGAAPRPTDDVTWPAAFRRQVSRTPHAVALVCADRELSYSDLNAAANRLARVLIERGVRAEDVVAVAVPRSIELVVALLAVMKAGAAYLPLDTDHPRDRVAYMLDDARAHTVITVRDLVEHLPEANLLVLDDETAALAAAAPFDVDVQVRLDQAAYVIYTSGSTGLPKGVVVSHDGIGSLIATATDRIGIDADSRVVQFASVGFDVTVWDLVMSLCVGGRAIIVPSERRVAGAELTDYIAEHRATHMILPPSLVAALPPEQELPEGAVLIVGTETVPAELIARWSRRMRVVAAYGLTEATVNSTLWLAEPGFTGPVPIGRPDPNTRCYVLDSALRPIGVGMEGELYVGGRGLARGYLGKPGLTAQRFVADPFAEPGARMYRTGDRARWRADGNLDFLGRADGQLKIRGHRIEPGEIESALMACAGVAQAAVVVRTDHRESKRLVAYFVGAADPADLRAALARSLPEHAVPSLMIPMAGPLPLTPNGKLDSAKLPAPDWAGLAGDAAPTTVAESTLAGIVADLLGLPAVGVQDSFFELGGDSIVAIQLVNRARAAGLEITPREVFEHRTVAALAALARSGGQVPTVSATIALTPAELAELPPLSDVLPATPLQEGFYFHSVADPDDTYGVQQTLDLSGEVDPAALRAALQRLLGTHPLLRAGFLVRDTGRIVQVIPAEVAVAWAYADLSAVDDQATAVADLAAEHRARGFDLGMPPLLRAALVKLGPRRFQLVLTLHHIIGDGWSVATILRDLIDGYGSSAPTVENSAYAGYFSWLATRDRAAARSAWSTALAGVQPTRLPAVGGLSGSGLITLKLSTGVTSLLTAQARALGLTLSSIVQSCFAIALGEAVGRTDVVFGTTVSGRQAPVDGIESVVGLLINTVPARLTWNADQPLSAVLRDFQRSQAELLDHQHLGLAEIQREIGVREDLFDAFVVVENLPRSGDTSYPQAPLNEDQLSGGADRLAKGRPPGEGWGLRA